MKVNYYLIISVLLSVLSFQIYASDNQSGIYTIQETYPDTTDQQNNDSISSTANPGNFNTKMERLIRIYPIPSISYSSETN